LVLSSNQRMIELLHFLGFSLSRKLGYDELEYQLPLAGSSPP